MSYAPFLKDLRKSVENTSMYLETYGSVTYSHDAIKCASDGGRANGSPGSYPLFRVSSAPVDSLKKPLVVVTAGFHGDEVAGPWSMASGLGILSVVAHKFNVSLVVYPCVNPSGFDHKTRYNAIGEGGRDGECGNNDFVRYLLKSGSWADDLGIDRSGSVGWLWSSDPDLKIHLPQETALLHRDIQSLPLDDIIGFVDLHQDPYTKTRGSYAYVFGDRSPYTGIVSRLRRKVPPISSREIKAGFNHQEHAPTTDEYGLLTRYDGSLADLFDNRKVPFVVTVETTTEVSLDDAVFVNWAWVNGVIELAGKLGR